MLTTVIAVLCKLAVDAACVEEIVTDSTMDPNVTFISCAVLGEAPIQQWMSEHPLYHAGWRLDKYRCVAGKYIPRSNA